MRKLFCFAVILCAAINGAHAAVTDLPLLPQTTCVLLTSCTSDITASAIVIPYVNAGVNCSSVHNTCYRCTTTNMQITEDDRYPNYSDSMTGTMDKEFGTQTTTVYRRIVNCQTCAGNDFELKANTVIVGVDTVSYNTCVQKTVVNPPITEGCSAITVGWVSIGDASNVQKLVTADTNGDCVYSYRCAAGYWGVLLPTETGYTGTCNQCAAPGTSVAGSTKQSDCYVGISSNAVTDDTGTYQYTAGTCYY